LLPTGAGVQTLTPVKTPTHNIRMVGPALHDDVSQADDTSSSSVFTWQHALCASKSIQLSVRAGLAAPAVRSVLQQERFIAELCRTGKSFQQELRVAVDSEAAAAAERDGQGRVPATALVSRIIIDCPTRWGSALVLLCRFVLVGPEVSSALSKNYHEA